MSDGKRLQLEAQEAFQQLDKGGGPLDLLKAECHSDEMRTKIFDGRTPITWHRISHYQNLTLKLIAKEMLSYGPNYGSGKEELTLVLAGEVKRRLAALSEEGRQGARGVSVSMPKLSRAHPV